MSSLALVDDGLFDAHESQDGPHPENPARLAAARAGLGACRLETRPLAPRDATVEELSRVHAESHLAKLGALEGEETWVDADTFVSPKSVAAARRAKQRYEHALHAMSPTSPMSYGVPSRTARARPRA